LEDQKGIIYIYVILMIMKARGNNHWNSK